MPVKMHLHMQTLIHHAVLSLMNEYEKGTAMEPVERRTWVTGDILSTSCQAHAGVVIPNL